MRIILRKIILARGRYSWGISKWFNSWRHGTIYTPFGKVIW